MKRNQNIFLWLFLLIIVLIFALPIPTYSKVLIVAVVLGAFIYFKRSVFYYVKANKKVTDPNEEVWKEAWPLYRKAIGSGLQKQFVITAASMFLQRGDAHEGKQIIQEYLSSEKHRNETLDNIAKTMISMAYWMEGDLQKAIDTVEEVYQGGYRDKNIFINYTTYALEAGDLKKAKELLDASADMEKTSPGIHDNRGWLYLLTGKWEKAAVLYEDLVNREPKFPEPYVHYAQVKIHYGLVGEAIALLEKALEARFANTSGMNKATITALKTALENPETRVKTAKEIDQDTKEVASGRLPKPINESFAKTDELILPDFAPPKELPKAVQKQEAVNPEKDDDEEERIPNTDLTEEDLAYSEKID